MKSKSMYRGPIANLPDACFGDCLFATGKRGYGKSNLQRVAMERALSLNLRCGWIDAMGIGWGITVAADGKPGFAGVVVFGGDHGDLPISENSGAALGATLAKATFSWVLDLKGLKSKAKRVKFLADFTEALYEECEDQLLLFLDEVDLWAPQMLFDKQGPAAKLLGMMDELVRRGRIKGINVWMATQRPAAVNKNVISQADALTVMKLTLPHDLEATMLWLRKHVGKEKAIELESSLPALKKGEAFVYLTEPDLSVTRVQFPLCMTLDTMDPAKRQKSKHVDRAIIDLEAIRAQIGTVEEELRANDPVALREQLADLQCRFDHKSTIQFVPRENTLREIAAAKADGKRLGYRKGYAVGERSMIRQVARVMASKLRDDIKEVIEAAVSELKPSTEPPADDPHEEVLAADDALATQPWQQPMTEMHEKVVRQKILAGTDDADVGGGALRMLRVLAQRHPAHYTMGQWAALSGLKKGGSTYRTYVSRLRTAGYLDESDGLVSPTPAGLKAAGAAPAQPMGPKAVQEMWRKAVGGGSAAMLDIILAMHPNAVSRDALAVKLNMVAGGSTFRTYLSRLKSNGLVFVAGDNIKAADILFKG